MSRLKTLSVLGGILAGIALSAASASAIWVSNNGSTRGIVAVKVPGQFNYAGQGTVKCPAVGIISQWVIEGSGQLKQQRKVTTSGPNLLLQVKSWGSGCEASVGVVNNIKPVSISECNFLITQQAASLEPVFATVSGCLIKVGTGAPPLCEIQIPAGMESPTSGRGINVGLKKTELKNETGDVFGKLNIATGGEGQRPGEGIFAESVGSNALCTLKPVTEEATLTGYEIEFSGIKAE
jgi:hypothetical protein